MKQHDEGYTLTEMLVVIAIIGMLAAVLTPVLMGQMSRARAKAARLQVENIATTLESFRSDVGRYPTAEEGLAVLVTEPADAEGWLGPYVRDAKSLNDPWGQPLAYRPGEEVVGPKIVSLGSDRKEGGTGAAADIVVP
jgi:general secretion pathway protein G